MATNTDTSKTLLKLVLIFIVVGLLTVVIGGVTIWSNWKTNVALEERIEAKHTANKSNYDAMWKKFVEMTQVTEVQAEQFKDVYTDLIAGRNQDQNLLFKAVQESNPQLDSSVYKQLSQEISAGRSLFDKNQQDLVDIIREYNTFVRVHIITAAIFNLQPKDADKYIVTSERTEKTFETGKDDVIDLTNKKK